MIHRFVALLLVGCFLMSLSGCTLFWGSDSGHKLANSVAANKEGFDDGIFIDNRHGMSHLEVILKGFHDMHRFWDRYFMNYDWEDPYIN